MQKAQLIAFLRYLLHRTVLPHSVKRLIYSMSSPLLHFHFLHCLSSSLKPTSPTEIMIHTAVQVALARPGKAPRGDTSRRAWNSCALAKPRLQPRLPLHQHPAAPSGQPCQAPEPCPQHHTECHLSPCSYESKTTTDCINYTSDCINYTHDTVQ